MLNRTPSRNPISQRRRSINKTATKCLAHGAYTRDADASEPTPQKLGLFPKDKRPLIGLRGGRGNNPRSGFSTDLTGLTYNDCPADHDGDGGGVEAAAAIPAATPAPKTALSPALSRTTLLCPLASIATS